MLLFDVGPVELQGIATVIIFGLIFYLLTELRTIRSEMKAIKPTERGNSLLPLQAYERLSLLADRLSLKNLVTRLYSNAYTAAELHVLLIDSIRTEYEHNITQQIYVNPEVWKAVTNMKEQNIYIINQLADHLPKNASALDLSKAILEYAGGENAELNSIVLDAIQYEVKKAGITLRQSIIPVLTTLKVLIPPQRACYMKEIKTDSGIEIKQVYTKEDLTSSANELPGEFPFTRGVQADMYRGKLWTMRQYAGFSTAEESNNRYHYLLSQGVNGLSVAFDLPTQIGYDSDHALSEGEVGKVGVAIDSLEDMEALFRGIHLEEITTSMTINATGFILLAFYIALAKKQGTDLGKISGTVQNDILKEYAARGTYIYPPKPSMRIVTDMFEWCAANVPRWNTISISGYHIREAGSTAVQEIAFTLSNGKAYVKAAIEKGMDIDVFGKRLSFFFNAHNNLFEEVAKFRAARKMWARIMKDLGATDLKAMMLRFHTQTGGATLTAQQPLNNVTRVAIQTLAAVLGGTQSLHTNGYDEALSLPTEAAARIALRTQQIVAFESGAPDTADPLAGSFFVESLTEEVEKEAWKLIEKIDAMGGSVTAIEQGFMQEEISKSAYEYQRQIENGEKIIVGVNKFQSEENSVMPSFKIDDGIRQIQIDKLTKLKAKRDTLKVKECLQRVHAAAASTDNLMPLVIAAVEHYCTLGEISDELRKVFGEYKG